MYPSSSASGTYITAIIIQLQLNFEFVYEVEYFSLPAVLAVLNPTSDPSVQPVGECSYSFFMTPLYRKHYVYDHQLTKSAFSFI